MIFGRITIKLNGDVKNDNIDLMKVIRERDEVIGSLELHNVHVYIVQTEDDMDFVTIYQSSQGAKYATSCDVYKDFPLNISSLDESFNIQNPIHKNVTVLVDYEHRA